MPKQCYYNVLGVESTVDGDNLKKAYKKCALLCHPDKNIGNEAAHNQFLAVREAYSVLSDPHERAWYDNHKEQILNDVAEEYEYFNVYPYFSSTCFSGYNDDDKGFYTIYRKVFEDIAAEEEALIGTKSIAPSFGKSDSPFLEQVEPFYIYWSNYCTQLKYYEAGQKVTSEYGRKAVKFVEKENKKKRDKLKSERNEEVRNLVIFVKKRDKRVIAWGKLIEKRKSENLKKMEEQRRKQILEKKSINETYKECDWSKMSLLENELENLEKSFYDQLSSDESDGEEQVSKVGNLYCVACCKLFKSEKAFENHEGSKKHKQNVTKIA